MLTAYPPEKRLESQQQETFALNLSKCIRIKGEFAHVEKQTNTQTGKMPKALVEPWWWPSEARAMPCSMQDVGKSGVSRHHLFSEALLNHE